MKKLIEEKLIRDLFEKWNVILKCKNDSTKYGSQNDEDTVRNEILGICQVKDIKRAEEMGAIIFQNNDWRIKTKKLIVDNIILSQTPKDKYHLGQTIYPVSDEWKQFENEWFKTKERMDNIEALDYAVTIGWKRM